jgi:hypothetical protein
VSIRIYYGHMRKLGCLCVIVLLAVGCGSDGGSPTAARNSALDQSAARFVVQVQAQLRRGRFAAAWRSLHPAEQRAVSASRLASCYPAGYYPRAVTFRANQVRDISWRVPGTSTLADAEAVEVTVKSSGKTIDTFEQHIVRRAGSWRWILSSAFFKRAVGGAC